MKKLLLLCFSLCLFSCVINSQTISFSFSANHTCEYSQTDSIYIENLSQGGDTALYWPDTVLNIYITGVWELMNKQNNFSVSQNYSNPFNIKTEFDIYVPRQDNFQLCVYDITGRKVESYVSNLEQGLHNFSFTAGSSDVYILTVSSKDFFGKIRMLQTGLNKNLAANIVYNGIQPEIRMRQKSLKSSFTYSTGDEMRFTGFVNGDFEQIIDAPEDSESYFFDMANVLPEQPSDIEGEGVVTENSTSLVYTVFPVEGVNYQWQFPPGWEITEGHGTNSVTVNSGESGYVSVAAYNSCGESVERTMEIFVCPNLNVGDEFGGGVVVYTEYPTSEHCKCGYLISSLSDQSDGIAWNNGVNLIVGGAISEPIGSGMSNTNAIIEVQGPVETDYAAGLARAYSGGGFNDWFLPSKNELNLLFLNKDIIGGFSDDVYWSSTDCGGCGANLSDAQNFTNGQMLKHDKFTINRVRAVRAY